MALLFVPTNKRYLQQISAHRKKYFPKNKQPDYQPTFIAGHSNVN
jgi:hypothetical protein